MIDANSIVYLPRVIDANSIVYLHLSGMLVLVYIVFVTVMYVVYHPIIYLPSFLLALLAGCVFVCCNTGIGNTIFSNPFHVSPEVISFAHAEVRNVRVTIATVQNCGFHDPLVTNC